LYNSEQPSQAHAGRPRKEINSNVLENLLQLRIPVVQIAKRLEVSRSVVYKAMNEYGINYKRFSGLTQAEVEIEVESVKNSHPNSGEVMVQGHLTCKGIHVQQEKVTKASVLLTLKVLKIESRSLSRDGFTQILFLTMFGT
jgi:hypothetical protein